MISNYWVRSVSYSSLVGLTPVGIGFIVFLALVRMLNTEEFGIWALFQITITLIESSRQALLHNGTIKFLSIDENKNRIKCASLIINLLYGVIFSILLQLVNFLYVTTSQDRVLLEMLSIYGITVIIQSFFVHSNILLVFKLNFKAIFFINLIRQGSFGLIVIFYFYTDSKISVIDLAVWNLVSNSIGAVFSFLFVKAEYSFTTNGVTYQIKRILNYGKYVLGTGLGGIISNSVDQFMLSAMVSNTSVAVYNTCIRIPNLVNIPANAIAATLFPISAKLSTNDKITVSNLFSKLVGANIAIISPVVLIILIIPEYVLYMIAGEQYSEFYNVLRLMIMTTLLVPISRQFGTILDSLGRPKINFYLTMGSAIFNILLNVILINIWGLKGAVIGTLISYIIAIIIIMIILNRHIDFNPLILLKDIYNFYPRIIKKLTLKIDTK